MTRRGVLTRAVGLTAVGVGGFSGIAASQPVTTVEVSEGMLGNFYTTDDLPVVDELLVFVHGWFGDSTVVSQTADVRDSIEDGGYDPDAVVAVEWPATNFLYTDAESDTESVGEVVAELIEDFSDAGGGSIRLTGHSLGGRIVYWASSKISAGYTIDTVGAMGTAAEGSNVCFGGDWDEDIATGAGTVRNYHSLNDTTVGSAYGFFGQPALGTEGAACSGPGNYTDVDVTGTVGSHLDYLGDTQVGSDFAAVVLSD